MALSYVGYDSNVRFCNFTQAAHLSKMIDSHFQYSYLGLLSDSKNSQWQPNLIVKVSLCFQYFILCFHNGSYKFFCCCFSNTPCNTNNNCREAGSIILRNITKRTKSIFYQNITPITVCFFRLFFTNNKHGSLIIYLLYKLMSVYSFSRNRKKQKVLFYFSRVNYCSHNLLMKFFFSTVKNAVTCSGYFFRCHPCHCAHRFTPRIFEWKLPESIRKDLQMNSPRRALPVVIET